MKDIKTIYDKLEIGCNNAVMKDGPNVITIAGLEDSVKSDGAIDWNNGKRDSLDLLRRKPCASRGSREEWEGLLAIMKSDLALENIETATYKGTVIDKAIKSMNSNSGSMIHAIPQIDWETISDHPLWIQGDYDGAVLDVMGLKWNEDKSGIVEN